MSKREKLSRCDVTFLRLLASELNNSFRDYTETSKEDIIKILTRRLSMEQIDKVIRLYLLCFDAKKVATKVKQNGVYEISEAIKRYFPYREILYEVPVGNHVCDIVLISDHNIIAIEIKSSSDKVIRSIAQTSHYKKWANKVYLVYDIKQRKKVKNLKKLPPEVGLLEFNTGQIKKIREAVSNPVPTVTRLEFMTYRFLREIAREFKVTTHGTKKEISKRLNKKISKEKVFYCFKQFLRSRSAYREKVAKQSVENEQIYPLTLFSEEQ